MTSGTISAIHIHPIKSCHRIEVESATVGNTGLEGDRQWQVSAGMKPVTQRNRGATLLATVFPELIDGGLRLQAEGHPTIEVAQPTEANATTGSLIGQAVTGVADAGDEAAAWFSRLLDDEVRLYARTLTTKLDIPAPIDLFGQPLNFADLAPVLVTNTASLTWLAERASEPFDMNRFRPNLVVDTDEPFVEETWARFTLGAAELRHGLAWPRCAMPQVDQESGKRGREPAVILKAHRHVTAAPELDDGPRSIIEGNSIFGVGCGIGPEGTVVKVGDPLQVTEIMEPLLAAP